MTPEEFSRLEARRDTCLSQYKNLTRKVNTQLNRVAAEQAKLQELQRLQEYAYQPLCIYQSLVEEETGLNS